MFSCFEYLKRCSWQGQNTISSKFRAKSLSLLLHNTDTELNCKLVILDFDGTVGDTNELIIGTMLATMAELGLERRSREACNATIGLPLAQCFRVLYPGLPDDRIEACADYSYLDMKTPVTGAPRHKLYAGANYHPGRFSFRLGGMWVDHLRVDLKGDTTEAYVLVNARASYRVFDWMEILLRGENLLAQEYQTMLGFPMPRATVLGGLSLKF